MPLNKGSAAMSFQVGFKSVGFFLAFKGYCIFDFPRTRFGCVRHITFVMFFQRGFQVFGTANVKMSSACFINENVNIMKVRHQAEIVQNSVCGSAAPCCPASSANADYAAAVYYNPNNR